MSYTPTEWKTGDVITSSGLNKMEEGIAAASSGGGGALVTVAVYSEVDQTLTLDKTAREIIAALPLAFVTEDSGVDDNHNYHRVIGYENYGEYVFAVESYEDSDGFVAATIDDYPVLDMK